MNVHIPRQFFCAISLLLMSCQCTKLPKKSPESEQVENRRIELVSTVSLDWTQARLFQSLPSQAAPNEYCSTDVVFDPSNDRLFRIDGASLFDLGYPEREALPFGYSNVWHDNCDAQVMYRNDNRHSKVTMKEYYHPVAALVAAFFAPGRHIYWMSERGAKCVPVRVTTMSLPKRRVARDPGNSDPSIEAFASIEVGKDALWRGLSPYDEENSIIPVAIQFPSDGHMGFAFMGTWLNATADPLFKCQCERLMRIMSLDTKEAHMLGRRLPKDPINKSATARDVPRYADEVRGYDTTQVERWFWDELECEKARTDALHQISIDGRLTVQSGFYSGYSQLE